MNFIKLFFFNRYIGNIIRQIEKYQQGGYNFATVPILQNYLLDLPILSEKEFYSHSTQCESKKGSHASVLLEKRSSGKFSFKLSRKKKK